MADARSERLADTTLEVARARVPRMPSRRLGPIALATALLVATTALGATQGAAGIPALDVLRVLFDPLPFVSAEALPETWNRIVFDVRLPRVVAAGVVGAALGFSGASYQGVFRNPLASPFLLGVASGAALGAAIAIISPLQSGAYGFGWVPVFAFAGAGVAIAIVYFLSQTGGAFSNTTLILAGVALSAVLSAITSFILLTGGTKAQPIFAFLFGTMNTATWERIVLALPYLAIGSAVVLVHARLLNVLQLDEDQASQLGVDVRRTKLIVLAGSSLMAAAAVSVAGVIGFVGLIVPHAARLLFGGDHRLLLPLSALLGASFLIVTDILARTLLAPQEIPVGIITAIAGGPFFLYLLRTRKMADL